MTSCHSQVIFTIYFLSNCDIMILVIKMKKILLVGILMMSIILTGCEKDKKEPTEKLDENISDTIEIENSDDAKLICTSDNVHDDYNYSIGATYVVWADDDNKITKIVSREIFTSTDDDMVDEYKEFKEEDEKIPLTYDGYETKITKKDKQIITDTTIDYSKFDLKKFVEDNKLDVNFDSEKELQLDNVEARYVTLGCVCEKK